MVQMQVPNSTCRHHSSSARALQRVHQPDEWGACTAGRPDQCVQTASPALPGQQLQLQLLTPPGNGPQVIL